MHKSKTISGFYILAGVLSVAFVDVSLDVAQCARRGKRNEYLYFVLFVGRSFYLYDETRVGCIKCVQSPILNALTS